MALRQNQRISRVADSKLTPEDKLRINKKAQEQWEEVIFPFEKDESIVFIYSREVADNLRQNVERSDLWKIIAENIDHHIMGTKKAIEYIDNKDVVNGWFFRFYWKNIHRESIMDHAKKMLDKLQNIKKKLYWTQWNDSIVDQETLNYLNKSLHVKMQFFIGQQERKVKLFDLKNRQHCGESIYFFSE